MPRWNSCNLLYLAPDAKRLWQFDAKGKGFVLAREQKVPHGQPLPGKWVAKGWASWLQPKLNVAWLPSESIFLRMVELPAANAEETFSMVELQLERLSPIPVTQIVWTMHPMGAHQGAVKADGTRESLQSIVVVIASRATVEEFLGRLERDGFQADRLEAPMLDQLTAVAPTEDGVWLFPLTLGGQNAALAGWYFAGAWRNLSFVTLPAAGDRAGELSHQLGLLAMAGEVEGWLGPSPRWHLVADAVNAAEWEQLLRTALNEPVLVAAPPPLTELAARSAARAAASDAKVQLQPPEFAERYREQFFDRLWLHALAFAGVAYAIGLVVYFAMVGWVGYQTRGVEARVAGISMAYTNSVQLKERLDILQKRSELKFAALDCWQLVAKKLPASVTLTRWGFVGGSRLVLNGSVSPGGTQTLSDFYDALRKAPVRENDPNSPPFFTATADGADALSYHLQGDTVFWSFALNLARGEEQQ